MINIYSIEIVFYVRVRFKRAFERLKFIKLSKITNNLMNKGSFLPLKLSYTVNIALFELN